MAAPVALTGAGDLTTATQQAASSITANKPTNTSDGDLLLAAFFHRNSRADTTSITVPSGWSALGSVNVLDETFGLYAKPIPSAAAETATSYTWTVTVGGSGRCMLAIFRVVGAALAHPLDAAGAQAVHTGTTSVVDPAVTAVSSSALLLALNVSNTTTSSQPLFTPPSGMTSVVDVQITNATPSSSTMQVAQQALASAGDTGTRTFAMSPAAANSGGFMVAIAPIATAAATLTAAGALSAAATSVRSAAATLASAETLTAGGQSPAGTGAALAADTDLLAAPTQTQLAGATLAASATMRAVTGYAPINVLDTSGIWQPVTLYRLVGGVWTLT